MLRSSHQAIRGSYSTVNMTTFTFRYVITVLMSLVIICEVLEDQSSIKFAMNVETWGGL